MIVPVPVSREQFGTTVLEELKKLSRPAYVLMRLAVHRGSRVLDRVSPGWEDRVDIDRISFCCDEHTAHGQLFPGKGDLGRAIGRDRSLGREFAGRGLCTKDFGFCVDFAEDAVGMMQRFGIAHMWRGEVLRRRDRRAEAE